MSKDRSGEQRGGRLRSETQEAAPGSSWRYCRRLCRWYRGPSANEGGVSTKVCDRFKTGNALNISKKLRKRTLSMTKVNLMLNVTERCNKFSVVVLFFPICVQ